MYLPMILLSLANDMAKMRAEMLRCELETQMFEEAYRSRMKENSIEVEAWEVRDFKQIGDAAEPLKDL